jgi:hypothetical protein
MMASDIASVGLASFPAKVESGNASDLLKGLGGMDATMLSTGIGSPIKFRGEAKSIGPGAGLLYAFTGFDGTDSKSDCIDDGGGGGVACPMEVLSRDAVGEGGTASAFD